MQPVPPAPPAPVSLREEELRGWKALGLAMTFGFVDAFSLMKLGVYTSFMTGNTTSTGVQIGEHKLAAAGHSLLPIPAFVVGALLGTLLRPGGKQSTMPRIFLAVAALLAIIIGAIHLAAPEWAAVLLLSAAMGMLATTISSFGGQHASLAFMSNDLKTLGVNLAKALSHAPVDKPTAPGDTHWLRAALVASVWASFLIGAVLGAIAGTRVGEWSLLAPMLGLLALAGTVHVKPSAVA